MAIKDTWHLRDGSRSKQFGQGKRWRVRWHEQSKSFDTRAAAEKWWLKLRTEKAEDEQSAVTVGELLDRWYAGKKGLSKSRQQGCLAAAERARKRWGSVLAVDVTEQDVREWQASLTVGASAIRKSMEALSGALQIAVKTGAVPKNECLGVRRPAEPKRDPRFLSPTELQLLAGEADSFGPMVLLMGTSGLRIGEACNLRVGDVDVRRRRIWIASKTSKTRKGREVPVRPSVLKLLPLKGRARTDWLFTSSLGDRIDEHNWRNRHFARAAEKAGLADITPHTLRHTAASLAVASGADVMAVQRMLGHASAKMTLDTYTGLWDQGLDDVMSRMDSLFGDQDDGGS